MSDSTEKARQAILAVYPNKTWKTKVDKMPDHQVVAVYMRLKLQRRIK